MPSANHTGQHAEDKFNFIISGRLSLPAAYHLILSADQCIAWKVFAYRAGFTN